MRDVGATLWKTEAALLGCSIVVLAEIETVIGEIKLLTIVAVWSADDLPVIAAGVVERPS